MDDVLGSLDEDFGGLARAWEREERDVSGEGGCEVFRRCLLDGSLEGFRAGRGRNEPPCNAYSLEFAKHMRRWLARV